MRLRIPYTGSEGHCTTNLALFMVTAPPPLYNGQGRPGSGSSAWDRTTDTLINSQVQLPLCYWGMNLNNVNLMKLQ